MLLSNATAVVAIIYFIRRSLPMTASGKLIQLPVNILCNLTVSSPLGHSSVYSGMSYDEYLRQQDMFRPLPQNCRPALFDWAELVYDEDKTIGLRSARDAMCEAGLAGPKSLDDLRAVDGSFTCVDCGARAEYDRKSCRNAIEHATSVGRHYEMQEDGEWKGTRILHQRFRYSPEHPSPSWGYTWE
jgi:hypothetical protein